MLLNGSAMHDYKDFESHDFDIEFFDPENRNIMFKTQRKRVPKEGRKYRQIKRIKNNDSQEPFEFSALGEEFEYSPWTIGGLLNHQDFAHIKIKIIYKHDIKVHYKSKEEALMDGFTNFNKNCINSKGIIYPFTGIRGDAKQLWRRVKILKSEDKVEFIKANNYSAQKTAIKNSDVIIWA
jgi:hypothetical protein